MLHTKLQENWPTGSGVDFLKGFYHIWAWWPSWSCDHHLGHVTSIMLINFHFLVHISLYTKLVKNGPVVSEQKPVVIFICTVRGQKYSSLHDVAV